MAGVQALRPSDQLQIGGYQLLGRLGEGGMGTVYLAQSPDGSQVALKVIRDHLLDRGEFRERFRGEVARAKTVPPFCTAEVIEADPDHDPPYLVAEYVDGPTLADIVKESGPLSGAALQSLGIGVATALTAIHGAGIIHRDLKPGNVLLPRGGVKVIDFGLARDSDTPTGITQADQVMGTVPYIAPERLSGGLKAVNAKADVFAWGAVMCYAATGHTPFAGDTPATTAIRILTEAPNLTGVSGPLRDVVAQALSKDPAERPAARELLDLLMSVGSTRKVPQDVMIPAQAAYEATADDETTVSTRVPVRKPRRRVRTLGIVLAAVIALVAAGIFAYGVWPNARSLAGDPTASPSVQTSPPTPLNIPDNFQLVLDDPLTKSDNWIQRTEKELDARCFYDARGFVTEVTGPVYRCQGPSGNNYRDFAVSVTVTLVAEGTCAGIWFRYNGSVGDALQICQDGAYFVRHEKDANGDWSNPTRLAMAFDEPLAVGQSARFTILAVGDTFTFGRDGFVLDHRDETTYPKGRINIGVLQRDPADQPTQYSAAFSHIQIWAPIDPSGRATS
ncbi:serine/threonine protein kinase [Hamadaea flava]|uniref:Serine/threonine-protein kinase n=1 Tax=Hamadaea flava TaxID=1742688 RepID=A0ABV8LM16_9ACTN|nr:serine/threonine-protein kinase [Hamadaea flava]MCP2323782.1 serine/threonine protein kinase [Hamadaea flava]